MYIAVMGLLTTVVTYSRYMTTFGGTSTVEVAKFNIDINDDIMCGATAPKYENYCNYAENRTTDEIEYYYVVDTTGVEVKTKFFMTLYVNDKFELEKLEEIDINAESPEPKSVTLVDPTKSQNINGTNFKLWTITDNSINNVIELGKGSEKVYKATLKYNNKDVDIESFNSNDEPLVKVDYSAMQVIE